MLSVAIMQEVSATRRKRRYLLHDRWREALSRNQQPATAD